MYIGNIWPCNIINYEYKIHSIFHYVLIGTCYWKHGYRDAGLQVVWIISEVGQKVHGIVLRSVLCIIDASSYRDMVRRARTVHTVHIIWSAPSCQVWHVDYLSVSFNNNKVSYRPAFWCGAADGADCQVVRTPSFPGKAAARTGAAPGTRCEGCFVCRLLESSWFFSLSFSP